MKKVLSKILAVTLALTMIFGVGAPAFAVTNMFSKTEREAAAAKIADDIVAAARAEIGFHETNINKFTTWYYGKETSAYWCTIFVSWCADQAGALETAVPKRAACLSMKNWFEARNEFYPADSDYVPQKGDIIFLNTENDGTDEIHHTEIVTESGFIKSGNTLKVKCIGGNTSNKNYEGDEYVTEKIRPVSGPRATVVGYAHPKYVRSVGIRGQYCTFVDDATPDFLKYFYSKLLSCLYHVEVFWRNIKLLIAN